MQNGTANSKRVFIIHGWGATPENGWYIPLAKKLMADGFEVSVPAMPNTEDPQPQEWVDHLKEIVGIPTPNDYFIGHSLGPTAIMLWMEQLPAQAKIGGALFVGGGFTYKPENMPEDLSKDPWYHRFPDFKTIKTHGDHFIALYSDDDPIAVIADKDIFAKELGASIIMEHNQGHFLEVHHAENIYRAFKQLPLTK